MFTLACMMALFFLFFFLKREGYTFWTILFFVLILLFSRQDLQIYAIQWNVSFIILFLVSIFLFRVMQPKTDWRIPFIIIGATGVYTGIEIIAALYTEMLRIDLSLLCGCGLFLLVWYFEKDLRLTFCLSVCSLFFATLFFGFGQLFFGRIDKICIGSLEHLHMIGWMIVSFIFFSLCERIQRIEKNYV